MLRSDLVNHLDFHKGYWFKSNISDWYYFKETNRPYNIPKYFNYNLVDKDILSLVVLLHRNNIPTSPSCSGHNLDEFYFEDLYDKIKVEEHLIKTIGLNFKNIETEDTFFYQDKNYKFSYPKEAFIKLALPYCKQGILGVLGDFSYIDNIEGLTISRDGNITLFHAVKDNAKVWKDLESAFRSIWEH